jgi:hypothetical protein
MAGYSGTPLAKKLGIKAGQSVVLINEAEGFRALLKDAAQGGLPAGVRFTEGVSGEPELVVFFTTAWKEVERMLPQLRKKLAQDGMIWMAWPKKSSKVSTELTEDVIRNTALALDLVDVKVCAIDDKWSGLKLVIPVKSRTKKKAAVAATK